MMIAPQNVNFSGYIYFYQGIFDKGENMWKERNLAHNPINNTKIFFGYKNIFISIIDKEIFRLWSVKNYLSKNSYFVKDFGYFWCLYFIEEIFAYMLRCLSNA